MVRFQLVINALDPDRLACFWPAALHYGFEPVPEGFDSWDDYYRDLGVSEDALGVGVDSISDPEGSGPRVWFQHVTDHKTITNRLHLDIAAGGGRAVPIEVRTERVEAEAQRLVGLGGNPPTETCRAGAGSRRGGDARPGGQRVRHQLMPRRSGAHAVAAVCARAALAEVAKYLSEGLARTGESDTSRERG